ncbi:MAG: hypothetical protein M0T80_10665 [Actinomycetota bacterium]|nr:hypothetical protein [Actinomycetota bacterium]
MSPTTTIDDLYDRAMGFARSGTDPTEAVAALAEAATGARPALEEARNRVARHMHGSSADATSGVALSLLNRALVEVGWIDPYQWKQRLGNRLRKP